MPCGSFFTHLGYYRTRSTPLTLEQLKKKCSAGTATPHEWARLVAKTDEFDDKCPWDLIATVRDWTTILESRPELGHRCNWRQFLRNGRGFGWLRPVCLYTCRFADRFDWSLLGDRDWSHFARNYVLPHPELRPYCKWEALDKGVWQWLLRYDPDLARFKPPAKK